MCLQEAGFEWDSEAENDEFFDDFIGTSPLLPAADKYRRRRALQKEDIKYRKAIEKAERDDLGDLPPPPRGGGPVKKSAVAPQYAEGPAGR